MSALWRSPAPIGLLVAALAALYRLWHASSLTNDDFSHITLARQFLAGDLPIRDFVDSGITLTWGLSAVSQAILGHRLLSEAVIVAIAFFVSAYAVFAVVRTLSGSTVAAASAAILLILAGPRGYSYPKILVYAVAAALWWQYVRTPSRRAAIGLGLWTALAFYWRPDHGVYVAAGVPLAMIAAHGFRRPAVSGTVLSGATAFLLVLPYFAFVASMESVSSYVADKFTEGRTIHTVIGSHEWPEWPIHRLADIVHLAPPAAFGPPVSLRWADDAAPAVREAVLARHHLGFAADDDARTTHVRLADPSARVVLALLNDPAIADTAGINRSTAVPTNWSSWEQLRYKHRWLRLRVLAPLEDQENAGEAAARMFYLLPVIAFAVLVLLRRHLAVPVTPTALGAFCAFALIVEIGMLRTPHAVRAPDAIVMPAILLGCIAGVVLKVAATGGLFRRIALRTAIVAVIFFVMTAVATVGQFGEHMNRFTGGWRSMLRVWGAWSDSANILTVSPPLRYYKGLEGPSSIRLARYANACVPPTERLAVLWFAPDIYYYSDRLMAIRHMVFSPGLVSADEQKRTREKFARFTPPIVFAQSVLLTYTRGLFPDLVADVERDYVQIGSIEEDDGFLVLVRRGRTATGTWGPLSWPCFR